MRLDKLLKNARLEKRRTTAKRDADAGRLLVNGRSAKPSREVHAGDRLTLVVEDPAGEPRRIEYEILAEPLRPIPRGQEGLFYRRLG